jgi:MFS family permease
VNSPTAPANLAAPPPTARREVTRWRDLSPQQWRSGIAAWLGWTFDGLDMHLYGLVAGTFVAALLGVVNPADPLVKEKSSYIQAAFLVGWALGGGCFGRAGDLIGRSRALSLTILTYALFTGLSFFAQNWWQLLIFRFLTGLGIGGEWAVGSALLAETWPRRWRPWIAAVLQTGVNIGVLVACATVWSVAEAAKQLGVAYQPRWVFLVGVLPALLVFWIRRKVPEPEEWHSARVQAAARAPGIRELFGPAIRRTTCLTILVCAASLTAWWAFMFWHSQHLRNHPDLSTWAVTDRDQLVSQAFFIVITASIGGNFFAGWLARCFGYRRAIAIMCAGFFLAMLGSFHAPHACPVLVWRWFPAVGFFSGVFGLFTMYLPGLFPTLLRTTGAGFCYNIGRLLSAAGVVFSGALTAGGDFRRTLFGVGFLFLFAGGIALLLPEPPDPGGPSRPDAAGGADRD